MRARRADGAKTRSKVLSELAQGNVSVEWERTDVAPGVRRRTVARTQFIIEGVEGPERWGISTVVSVMGVHLA